MKIRTAAAVLAAFVVSVHAEEFPRITRIADGIFAYEQIDPTKRGVTVNNLIVVTGEGVLVADGQGTPANTARLVADVATLTDQPIRYVVVGSVHGDHRGGDGAFPSGVRFLKEKQELTLGGREIQILFLGRAHTGSDLEVYLPRERVMFTSEVFSNRIFPSMANAYPTEWLSALGKAEQMAVDTYVPAHALTTQSALLTSKDELRLFHRALDRVVAEGRRLHDAHVPSDAAVGQADFGEFGQWFRVAENAPAALKRVYMELDRQLSGAPFVFAQLPSGTEHHLWAVR